ncbi:hypothetical protein BK120_27115 [Paenibacillus sp. FSL A5-0031]|uniref:hypothetical protein n=1 Tax=Paenibacillus sp. FSL A5-0031 TaxID=1920420 RepID=UPI00096EA899|nr:hypothetical protein [Paenibacillus sp. FSL A5-0031]OME77200.1 hypothetical protein BK120_27115 [Paenibacillus sp. FSL A5-0031]
MRHFILLLLLTLVLVGCNEAKPDFDNVSESLVNAERVMNDKDLVITTATSSQSKIINFRILIKDRINNEQAKGLVNDFFNEIDKNITDLELFKKTYSIKFDIKSQKDGQILYQGKREKEEDQIWWQF